MKKNHTNSRGLVKSCLVNPIFKNSKNKSPTSKSNNSQILNYLIKNGSGSSENKEESINFDSPYKNILTEPTPVLNNSFQEENDFKYLKPFVNLKPEGSKSYVSKTPIKKRKCGKSTLKKGIQKKLTNMISDNFSLTDTNPEHLQIALALSKSEQPEENNPDSFEITYPSTQTKILKTRQTLEKFGFKTGQQIMRTIEAIKKPKKSRYQYITPILYLRTDEDRQNLISSKISIILSQNSLPTYNYEKIATRIKSKYLADLVCEEVRLFNFNTIQHTKLDTDLFYVRDLKLEKSNTKCGHLLKDWSSIPGREKTPERDISSSNLANLMNTNTITDASQTNIEVSQENINISIPKRCGEVVTLPNITSKDVNQEKTYDEEIEEINLNNELAPRTISPDLFESEEETTELNKTVDNTLRSSLDMISNIKLISLSQSILELKKTNTGMFLSIENDESDDIELQCTTLENGKISISTPQKESNSMSKMNTKEGECDETSFSDEIIKITEDDFPILDMQEYNLTNDRIYDSTIPQNKVTPTNLTDKTLNQTKNCREIDEYATSLIEFNNTDDILTTLEITLTKDITSVTPNNRNINVFSASQLSNFDSLDQSGKQQIYEISSDNSDYNITTYENLDGIQCFESFYDENHKKEKNTDFNEFDLEYSSYKSNYDETSNKSKNNHLSCENKSLNDADSLNYVFDGNTSVDQRGNNITTNFEEMETNLTCKVTEKQCLKINNTKSRFERCKKKTYEILSDSDNTCIYEFENDNEWQDIYRNSSIRQLLEKSIINHESLQSDKTKTASGNKETGLRKSLSFAYLETNNYKPEVSRDIKRHASYTTPSPNKNHFYTNKYIKDFKKYSSNSSASSENYNEDGVICISDEELNYSSRHSTPYGKSKSNTTNKKINLNVSNTEGNNASDKSVDVLSEDDKNVSTYSYLEKYYDDIQYNTNVNHVDPHEDLEGGAQSPLTHRRILELSNKKTAAFKKIHEQTKEFLRNNQSTPINEKNGNTTTPDGQVIVKTTNVTPMPNFDNMNTPTIIMELQKIGVKQLKRHRGVQILKHIYETTHPVAGNLKISENEDDIDRKIIKRRKLTECKSRRKLEVGACSNNVGTIEKNIESDLCKKSTIEIVGDISESGDLIFERKQSKKISGCAIPLHVAFHNLVSNNEQLKQSILLYEPVQLEVLYAMLKKEGFKYHIQDLLTFLDKKCITVRTSQNIGQRRRY